MGGYILRGAIMGKILHFQLTISFSLRHLNNAQFIFGKNSSAVLQLLIFVDELHNNYDSQENDELHVLFLDFRKAFDSFLIKNLSTKCHSTDGGKLLSMIGTYLSHRLQRVKISDASFFPVTSGVPQGSIMGPLFFIVDVNDLCNVLTLTICVCRRLQINFKISSTPTT